MTSNRPQLSSCASWNPNAATLINASTNSLSPGTLFIDPNNTVFYTSSNISRAQFGTVSTDLSNRVVYSGPNQQQDLAIVTSNSNVYVRNSTTYYLMTWPSWIGTVGTFTANINDSCFSLFVDQNNTVYCSMSLRHTVFTRSFLSGSNAAKIVAGNVSAGSGPLMLNTPRGIFLAVSTDLYVADCGNNRVQLFPSGQPTGTTVAGNGVSGTITLNCPMSIVLDRNGYLFIADQKNHRIVGAGPTGFRCIVGCSSQNGSASFQLKLPSSLAFDITGNLYVMDSGNGRMQVFSLGSNTCGKSDRLERNFHALKERSFFAEWVNTGVKIM